MGWDEKILSCARLPVPGILIPCNLLSRVFEKVRGCKQPTIRRFDFVEQNPLRERMSSEGKVENRLHKARVFKSLILYNFTKIYVIKTLNSFDCFPK